MLPISSENGKLLFALCSKCTLAASVEACTCDNIDRSWIGTYHTTELSLALKRGYQIVRVYEMYNWPENQRKQFNKEMGVQGIFSQYIDRFIKIKCQASGFPHDVVTDEQKDDYVQRFFEREGIRLNRAEIATNPPLRLISKLLLNSLW